MQPQEHDMQQPKPNTAAKDDDVRQAPTLDSSVNDHDPMVNASWKIKLMVLICMLTLPGKSTKSLIKPHGDTNLFMSTCTVGCHYMEATMGTLKTSLKKVNKSTDLSRQSS